MKDEKKEREIGRKRQKKRMGGEGKRHGSGTVDGGKAKWAGDRMVIFKK